MRVDWLPDGLRRTDTAEPFIRPVAVQASVGVRVEWPPPGAADDAPPALHVDGSASLAELRVLCTPAQLEHAALLARIAPRPAAALARDAQRPAVRPLQVDGVTGSVSTGTAAHWWRYALDIVCAELREERLRLSWRWLKARALQCPPTPNLALRL